MKLLVALIKKDLVLEFRGREALVLLIVMAILLSVVTSFGITGSFVDQTTIRKLYPALLWIIFVFGATVSVGKTYDYELEHAGLEGLLLAGVSPVQIYLAKSLQQFVSGVYRAGDRYRCAVGIAERLGSVSPARLVLVTLLTVFGYTALAALFAAMTGTARMRQMLLPLILLPLLFPLFIAATELTAAVIDGSFDLTSPWLSVLIGLDVIYLVLGVNLFEFVVRD